MNLSDIFNKINHILTEKKTDPAILEGPLFIQNTTDQSNVPILDEEKEDVIIDTPVRHNKLKKKCDDEQEKSIVEEEHLIENEKVEINESTENLDNVEDIQPEDTQQLETQQEASQSEEPEQIETTPEVSQPVEPQEIETPLEESQPEESQQIETPLEESQPVAPHQIETQPENQTVEGELSDEASSEEIQEMVTAVIKEHFPEIHQQKENELSDKIENEPLKEQDSQIEIVDSNDFSIQVSDVRLNDHQPESKDDSMEQKEEPKKKKKSFFEKYLKISEKPKSEDHTPSPLLEDHVASQDEENHAASQVAEDFVPSQVIEDKLEVTAEQVDVEITETENTKPQKNPSEGWEKTKAFFSKIKASEFYKRKDFKIGASIFMVSLIIFIGSIMTSTKPVSPETFASLAQESGLSLTDITQTFSEKTEGVISSQTAISETGWTVDFDVFTNGDIAKQNWERNVMVASQYKNDSILEDQQNRNNIMTYSLTSNGYYFYVAKVNNTVLSVAALNTNREAAETFISQLGYDH